MFWGNFFDGDLLEDMGSNPNAGGGWIINYGGFMEDVHASDFIWAPQVVDDPSASR